MPRIATYQPGQVGPVETTSARFRAPDVSRSGLAEGLQEFGQAVGQYADSKDHLLALSEETQARSAALDARAKLNESLTQYGTLQGGNAIDAQAKTLDQLKTIKDGAAQGLGTPRMKAFFDRHFEESYADAVNRVNGHAIQQVQVQHKGVLMAETAEAQDAAALPGLYKEPDKFGAAIGQVRDRAKAYADFAGLGEASGEYVKEQVGSSYEAAIHQALGAQDVEFAKAILDAHHDDMTADQKNRALSALQKPLQDREADLVVDAAMSGLKAAPVADASGNYQMPVTGKVTNTYAQHEARGSKGLDIAASVGSAIHPIAGGTVTQVTQDDRAGKWVMVKHPDGTTSTYAHMGNQSVKVGDEVDASTVIGTVGMTGHTTGPHVHLRIRDASGADVDPEKVVGSKAGAAKVAGQTSAARNWDQAAVIANIKAMGLPPEKERNAVDRAMQRMRQSEQLLADQQGDAADRVHEWIGNYSAQNGGKYPPPEALPAFASGMKPADLAELKGSLARARKADTDAAVRKEQDWTALNATLRMYGDPQGFMRADIPKEYMGKVSMSDYAQIVTAQARMRADASKPQAWSPFADTSKALSQYTTFNGTKLDEKQKATVLQTMKAQADDLVSRTGRPPTDSEWYDFARRATRNVSQPGRLWGTNETPLYEVSRVDQASRDKITKTFRDVFKRDPTDDEVLQWYRRQLAGQPQ